jgi:Asp-tRNA(Asn)/Glu-tRNA(Gln) amidotransferase C subunit
MKFDCEKCGNVDHVLIDGYGFAERMLEGVIFKVFYKDGKLAAEVMPEHADYFADFNQDKWLQECIEHVKQFEDDVEGSCPNCNGDIYLEPEETPAKKSKTAFISEGAWWVEIDGENNEVSRVEKAKFETGHELKPFAIYGAKLLREIQGYPEGDDVGVMTVPGGKLIILKHGDQIHLDAESQTDFEFNWPPNVIEDAPDDSDEKDDEREAVAEQLRQVEAFEEQLEEIAIKGVDLIAEMIEANAIDIDPANAKVEMFHGNGTHSDNGRVVIYDDSKVLKLEKHRILQEVQSGRLPGFIVEPDQVVSLLFLALQARAVLMSPDATMELRLGVSGDLFDLLETIGII